MLFSFIIPKQYSIILFEIFILYYYKNKINKLFFQFITVKYNIKIPLKEKCDSI